MIPRPSFSETFFKKHNYFQVNSQTEKDVGPKEVDVTDPSVASTSPMGAVNENGAALNGASAGGTTLGRRHRRRKIELIVVKTNDGDADDAACETNNEKKEEYGEDEEDNGFCHVLEESIVSIMREVAAYEDRGYNGEEDDDKNGGLEELIARNMLCKTNDVSRGDSALLRDSGLDSMTNNDESVVDGVDVSTEIAAKTDEANDGGDRGAEGGSGG